MYPQSGSDAECALCGPFVGIAQFTAAQRRPVGAEKPTLGWGKHSVRLYAVRTRRGEAPAPPSPLKGEKGV